MVGRRLEALAGVTWRRPLGLGMLAASDAAYVTALLLVPMWLVRLFEPQAGHGSALAIGSAVLILARALCARPPRGLLMIAGLGVGLVVCGVWWPALPAWAWGVCFAAGAILRAGARELTTVAQAGRTPMLLWFALSSAGLWLAGQVLALDATGAQSLIAAHTLLWFAAALWLLYATPRWVLRSAPSRWLDQAVEWWVRRARQRLATRGFVPLAPNQAPVLYRRVEPAAGGGWVWEVRDHDTIVSGHSRSGRGAERAANKAVFARTFTAPVARRPASLYVVSEVGGNPYSVQVVNVFD